MLLLALSVSSAFAVDWSALDAPLKTGASVPDDAAVVIGIEDYFKLPTVPYARADAKLVRDTLLYTLGVPVSNIRLLDHGASRETMLEAVDHAVERAGERGTVWVYFAGHGAASPTTGERMLLGDDVRADLASFESRAVTLSELRERASAGGHRVQLILDTCYTGQGRAGDELLPGARFAVPSYAVEAEAEVVEWSAAGPNQYSFPLEAARHGAFTALVVGAVRGWADGQISGEADGQVTLEEASLFVEDTLLRLQISDQRPVLSADAPTRWVLANAPGKLETTPTFEESGPTPPAPAPTPLTPAPGADPAGKKVPAAIAALLDAAAHEREVSTGPAAPSQSRSLDVRGYPLVRIPAGSFTMGDTTGEWTKNNVGLRQYGPHTVSLSRSFWMGKVEVTQALWTEIMGDNPSHFEECGPSCPVDSVSWNDAALFLNKLSEAEGLEPCYDIVDAKTTHWPDGPTCEGYRLPTEAEWEYAARAGGSTRYSGSPHWEQVAWFKKNAGRSTHPGGQKNANAFGLHDMSGNVEEHVWDWHGDYPGNVVDPTGPAEGVARCLRGASWKSDWVYFTEVWYRGYAAPRYSDKLQGLRLVRTIL